jgi:hypothetical protein
MELISPDMELISPDMEFISPNMEFISLAPIMLLLVSGDKT